MPNLVSALFNPDSVAVVGASRNPEKVGYIVLKNIKASGFKGAIYPVNPNSTDILGLKCYKDLQVLPTPPDLVVIAIPSEAALGVLNQIGELGIKNVVIFSAGFKEIGVEGAKLEQELITLSKKYNLNVLGPNCLGFVNNNLPINVTFGQEVKESGNLRFISQSGAIAASLFDWCASSGLGFSEFITLGNKPVVNENHVLEYFLEDHAKVKETGISKRKPIGMYLESISDGKEFIRLVRELSKQDPLFIIKPGKTLAAAKAMQSHTGAIAGEDDVLDAVLKDSNVTRCDTLEDFFDYARAFAWEEIPTGPKVAVISNAGGPAVISADALVMEGLELAEFDQATKAKLLNVLPRSSSIMNPVDVLGDALADRFMQASEIILQTNQCDALLVILTPQIMTQIEKTAEYIGTLSQKYNKPIFCSFIGGALVSEGETILNSYKIPSFRFPERAVNAMAAMWQYNKRLQKLATPVKSNELKVDLSVATSVISSAVKTNKVALDNIEADSVISSLNIRTPATEHVESVAEAKNFAQKNNYPVVLKLSSPGLVHKKHVGGVVLDIRTDDQLEVAWETLVRKCEHLDATIKEHVTFQIQKEIPSGIEVVVGIKKDPTFGHIMLFGAGGSFVELIGDKNIHVLPIDLEIAKELVQKSKIYKLLQGANGEPEYALNGLYDAMVKLSQLISQTDAISEIEINPVIITLNDMWAVDPKVLLLQQDSSLIKKEAGAAIDQAKPKPAGPKFKLAGTLAHKLLAAKFHYYDFETEQPFNLLPGQYVSVKVASDRINCYSVAGHTAENKFNLFVDTTPGGPGSKFFENLKVGDIMTFLGPFGTFTFKPKEDVKTILFFATGSGIAPLKYMIESAVLEHNLTTKLVLYIGLNYVSDIFFDDYFGDLAKKYPNFRYSYVIYKPDATWFGEKGFVTNTFDKEFSRAADCSAYLCGNKFMIADVTNLLIAKGCPKERIYTEKYV